MERTFWCQQQMTVTVDGPYGAVDRTVEKPLARVGSREGSEIHIRDPNVAERSLYLHATDGGIHWLRLAAPDALDRPLRGCLESGEPVELGSFRITARLVDGARDRRAETVDEAGFYPTISVRLNGREVGQRALRHRLTLVGRQRPCSIWLKSDQISDSHCVLAWDQGELWVIDLLSDQGVRVGDRRVDVARIEEGESCFLGKVELARIDAGEAEAADKDDAAGHGSPEVTRSRFVQSAGAQQQRVPAASGKPVSDAQTPQGREAVSPATSASRSGTDVTSSQAGVDSDPEPLDVEEAYYRVQSRLTNMHETRIKQRQILHWIGWALCGVFVAVAVTIAIWVAVERSHGGAAEAEPEQEQRPLKPLNELSDEEFRRLIEIPDFEDEAPPQEVSPNEPELPVDEFDALESPLPNAAP